jgi:hypothetical protein
MSVITIAVPKPASNLVRIRISLLVVLRVCSVVA